jgi:hypothetical protein
MSLSILQQATNDTYSDFSFQGLHRVCKVVDIYDADTFRVVFFLQDSDKDPIKIKVRADGCNACEMFPLKKHKHREEEMKKARIARNRLLQLVTNATIDIHDTGITHNDVEYILSKSTKLVYISFGKFDKYGRVLGTLYESKESTESINIKLINEKHAIAYYGGKRNKEELTV